MSLLNQLRRIIAEYDSILGESHYQGDEKVQQEKLVQINELWSEFFQEYKTVGLFVQTVSESESSKGVEGLKDSTISQETIQQETIQEENIQQENKFNFLNKIFEEHNHHQKAFINSNENSHKHLKQDQKDLLRFHPNEKLPRKFVDDWGRVGQHETYKSKKIINNLTSPLYIQQGDLGDCYLISALSSLAQKPNFIKKLFKSEKIKKNGNYDVKLCDSGIWENLQIDDFIPFCRNSPIFAKSSIQSDIWGLLLEKAYAKLFGSYFYIQQGSAIEAFSVLTGAPCIIYNQTNILKTLQTRIKFLTSELVQESIMILHWKFIENSFKQSYLLNSEPFLLTQGSKQFESGIKSNHIYSILDLKVIIVNNMPRKVIQLRNPWGSQYLSSQFKDNSVEISNILREKCQVNFKKWGSFWLYFEDYHEHFELTTACMIKEDYCYKALKVQTKGRQYSIIKLQIKEFIKNAFIIVNQPIKRKYELKYNDKHEYSPIFLYLAKTKQEYSQQEKEWQEYNLLECNSGREQQVFLRVQNLEPGEYTVFVDSDWVIKGWDDFVLSVYSNKQVESIEHFAYQSDDEGGIQQFYLDIYSLFAKALKNNIESKFLMQLQGGGGGKCQK